MNSSTMKTRPIRDLLILILANQQHFVSGLCQWIYKLYRCEIINDTEYNYLVTYLALNKPRDVQALYWWQPGYIQPRIEWLKNQLLIMNTQAPPKDRSIKELLKLMLLHQDKFRSGLCDWVTNMHSCTSYDERNRMYDYIDANRPWYTSWRYIFDSSYWWKKGSLRPRVRWIKRHIKKNS